MKYPYLVCDRNGTVLSSHPDLASATAEVVRLPFWTYVEHLDESHANQN